MDCNKQGGAAGHGEAQFNGTTMTYWMVAYFSDQISQIKKGKPEASMEEVLFYNLDRWGLPMVPRVRHAFKISLCKGPDHGIVMELGFLATNGEPFDPVKHINLSIRTVEMDAWLTNNAISNYAVDDWACIRTLLRRVPLQHSFWKIDKALGDDIWNGSRMISIVPTRPLPDFSMRLLPIDDWIDAASVQGVLQQQYFCGERFSSISLLLRHCQERHQLVEPRIPEDFINPVQDDVDKDYWDNWFLCVECGAKLTSARGQEKHRTDHHSTDIYQTCGAG